MEGEVLIFPARLSRILHNPEYACGINYSIEFNEKIDWVLHQWGMPLTNKTPNYFILKGYPNDCEY